MGCLLLGKHNLDGFLIKKTLCIEQDFTKNRLGLVKTNRAFFRSVFSLFEHNTGKYGPGKSPYLDTFHVMVALLSNFKQQILMV